jgi:hypothetical protein
LHALLAAAALLFLVWSAVDGSWLVTLGWGVYGLVALSLCTKELRRSSTRDS